MAYMAAGDLWLEHSCTGGWRPGKPLLGRWALDQDTTSLSTTLICDTNMTYMAAGNLWLEQGGTGGW